MTKQVVLSFDDSTRSHYTVVFPLLKQYGCTGVFSVITQRPFASGPGCEWRWAKEIHDSGNALVAHTHTHPIHEDPPGFNDLPTERRQWEIEHSIDLLKRFSCFADGFVYPQGQGANLPDVQAALARNGIRWALRGRPAYNGTTFAEMKSHPLCIPRALAFQNHKGVRPSDSFKALLHDTIPKTDRVAIVTFHGVADEGAWDNISSDEFEEMLRYVKEQGLETVTRLGEFV
jgi:peptidoglycan/xylan/chitin deacetylase (PgdA/CDA1 family)